MRTRPNQNAFSSGEISPLLHARADYQRYQTGLRTCNGFLPMLQGGITRAPGTIFRGMTHNNAPARLVDFEFAENDTLLLEFTPFAMRIWRYGELIGGVLDPYVLATPYDAAAIQRLSWVQSADVILLADGVLPVQKLSRFALDNWTIQHLEIQNGPFRVQNLDRDKTVQCSAADGSITITATGDIFSADWIGALLRVEAVDYTDIPIWTGNTPINVGDMMRYDNRIYKLTAGSDTGVNAPLHDEGTQLVDKEKGTTWEFLSGVYGIVKIEAITDANHVTATVIKKIPTPCISAPTYRWAEGAFSNRRGWPSQLEIIDQSLVAAFTHSEPRTIWFSTGGDLYDFDPSADADGSFGYTIGGSTSLNAGNWLKNGRRGLYIGTLGEVRRGFSNSQGQRIGPTTFDTSIEANDGTRRIRPITPYGYPIFITKDGTRVQELRYSFDEDGGNPIELSRPSQHLGADKFKDIAWQSAPQRICWLVSERGQLVAMIYDPSEEVLGWARCSIAGGEVISIATTTDVDGNDILTMVVRRHINGEWKTYIEEQSVNFAIIAGDQPISHANHFFSSVIRTMADGNFFTSVDVPHLIGQTVSIWTDQGEIPPMQVPQNGALELPFPVGRAVIGLFDADHVAETLPISTNGPDGSSTGRKRRLHSGLAVTVHRTAAGHIQTIERKFAQPEKISAPRDLIQRGAGDEYSIAFSGISNVTAPTGYADEVSLRFSPVGGAPMTIMAVTAELEGATS